VNAAAALAWVAANRIDVLFFMVGEIASEDLLRACRLGLINKHASLLPSCRGAFPYFWALLRGLPTGVTFHRMVSEIDGGPILCQRPIAQRASPGGREKSMLEFYAEVFRAYPEMALAAIDALAAGRSLSPALPDCYFSFPTREDYASFAAAGHAVVRLRDLLQA
jgi:methionyl-tRNA formyltransferase